MAHPYRDLTKGMVHIGFSERLYRLPPTDPPQILSKREPSTYNTLCVGGDTTRYSTIAGTFVAFGGFFDAGAWYFQESENAPNPSVHPPPANDDDPKLRPLHRTFNVPKTVPKGTIDKVLYFLGGVQQCDLPVWVTPCFQKVEDVTPSTHKTASSATGQPNRKASRTETSASPSSPSSANPPSSAVVNPLASNIPWSLSIEARIPNGGPAKALSGDLLRQLLTLRDSTAVTGTKSAQASRLMYAGDSQCYHTVSYRKAVYKLVKSGAIPIASVVPVATTTTSDTTSVDPFSGSGNRRVSGNDAFAINGSALSPKDAAESLPWNEEGIIKQA